MSCNTASCWTNPPEGVADADTIVDDGFFVGDVVSLITGSVDMSVIDVCDECGVVTVCWYDDHDGLQFADLPEEVLI
jgi:uncharacterized protein YodC (DUF2158 family)